MLKYRAPRTTKRPSNLALPAFTLVIATVLVGCSKQDQIDPELSAQLILPVARLELKVEKTPPGNRTGEQIYKSICSICHDAATLGAPKTGDTAAWAPRISLGFEALTHSVINGKNAMPPRAGASDLTDTEIQRAVAHLANLAGGNFTEPPLETTE